MVARYGGEEFAIILPNTPMIGALVVADRILTALKATALKHPTSPTSCFVTASIGVASDGRGSTALPTSLITLADNALYRAKREGRNRVVAEMARGESEGCSALSA